MQRSALSLRVMLLLLLAVLPACSGQDVLLRQQVDAQATEIAQLKATATPTITPSPTATPTATPSRSVGEILRQVAPSVVRVRSSQGEGSGFVAFKAGEVLTAYHVLEDASARPTIIAHDGSEYTAVIVGADETKDIALLAVPALPVEPLTLAGDVSVGDAVIAVGYAAGLPGEPSITRGIVSGKRQVSDPPINLIQTDAPINPGNSGGPLLNEAGEVVGLNIFKGSAQAGLESMGFAVSATDLSYASDSLRGGLILLLPMPTPRSAPIPIPAPKPAPAPRPQPTPTPYIVKEYVEKRPTGGTFYTLEWSNGEVTRPVWVAITPFTTPVVPGQKAGLVFWSSDRAMCTIRIPEVNTMIVEPFNTWSLGQIRLPWPVPNNLHPGGIYTLEVECTFEGKTVADQASFQVK